jgi:hypothetical protein
MSLFLMVLGQQAEVKRGAHPPMRDNSPEDGNSMFL